MALYLNFVLVNGAFVFCVLACRVLMCVGFDAERVAFSICLGLAWDSIGVHPSWVCVWVLFW